MTLARFERDFTDDSGNLLTGNVTVAVAREAGGPQSVYSDRAGTVSLGSTWVQSGGSVAFYAVGGAYRITVTQGASSRVLRYVPIGTKQEQDAGSDFAGFVMQWETGTSAPPSAGSIRANNASLSSATSLYVSEANLAGSDIAARLGELVTGDRIALTDRDGRQVSWNVDAGGVTDSGAHRTIAVTSHAGETSLSAGSISLQLQRKGTNGSLGGSTGSTDNRLLRADGTGGATAQSSEVTVDDSGNMSGGNSITLNGGVSSAAAVSGLANFVATRVSDSNLGADMRLIRSRAGPAAVQNNDRLGEFSFNGYDGSSVNTTPTALIRCFAAENWTTTARGSYFTFETAAVGGTARTERLRVKDGLYHPSATGGDKGNNTINFGAVYDDNTLLTCMALQQEFLDRGEVDLDKWDALVPDQVVPEQIEQVPVTYTRVDAMPVPVVEEVDGRLVQRIVVQEVEREEPFVWADPIYDETGAIVGARETALVDEVVVPEQVIPRQHGTAHLFAAMLAEGFDPRDPAQYIAKLKFDQALPGMPNRGDWEHNSLSSGEMFNRLWLATEMLAIVVMNLHDRVTSLERG